MIFLILIPALILRLISLNQSLWFDEAINVVYARSSDFWWFVTKYPVGDFHPPGWFAILWVWGSIFGFSEISVRLPSVFLGVATVGLVFLLGKELFNKKIGLLAAFLLAIAPLHVYYSQEARMYVFAAFAVSLSFYFLQRLIANKKGAGLGLVISLVLVLSSDYLAYLVIPAQIIYLIWVKKLRKEVLMSFLVVGVIFIPWLAIFPAQLKKGINTASILPGWTHVVGSNFKDLILFPVKTFFGRVTILDKSLYAAVAGFTGIIFGSIFLYGLKKIDREIKLLVCWLLVPVVLAFMISLFIPVLAYFRMIFILPAFYLVLAKGLIGLPRKITIPAGILICVISLTSLFGYYINPKFQRENWRDAVSFTSHNLDNQTLVVFENNEIPAPVRYYASDLSNFKPGLTKDFTANLNNRNKIFLFEYLTDVYDPERTIGQKLKELNFVQTQTYDFPGVGFINLYVK